MLAECMKCGGSREIKLKIDGDKAVPVCTDCGTPQTHFSRVMINTMRSNKDVIHGSSGEEHVPFGFPCTKCMKTEELVYDKKANIAKCSVCGTPANVSPYTMRGLELTGHVKRSSELSSSYDGGGSEPPPSEQSKGKVKRQVK